MSLLTLIVVLVIVGVALYLINKYIPLDPKIKVILNWAVVIIVIIWLLRSSGLLAGLGGVKI